MRFLGAPILLLAAVGTAAAADLSADFRPAATSLRADAPAAATVTLDWHGAGILEGTLRIAARNGEGADEVCEIPDLALAEGERVVRATLPPLGQSVWSPEAKLSFVRSDGTEMPLGSFPLSGAGRDSRALTICVSGASVGAESARLWAKLRFEQFAPTARGYQTYPAIVPTDELPTSPLGYCPYDLLILAGRGFGEMRERQLEAVRAWVRAGGSVLVAPGDNLKPYHATFLAQMNAAGEGRSTVGLGRCAIVRGAPTDEAVRDAALFLWKFRDGTLREIARQGRWSADAPAKGNKVPFREFVNGLSFLVPSEVSAIPPWAVLGILGAFVVCVGPLDYFALGKMKRRHWTWAVFPCLSVGFAFLAVKVSEHYLGTADHRNSLTFVDVDGAGEVLRTNRFEVVFASGRRRIETDVAGALTAPLPTLSPGSGSGATILRGRFPERYALAISVEQWQATGRRFLSIGGTAPHRIDWSGPVPTCAGAEVAAAYRMTGSGLDALLERGAGGPSVGMLKNASRPLDFERSAYSGVRVLPSLAVSASPSGGSGLEDLPVLDPTDPSQSLLVAVIREGENWFVYRKLESGSGNR